MPNLPSITAPCYGAGLSDQHIIVLHCRLVCREGQALRRSEILEILCEFMLPRLSGDVLESGLK